MLATINNQTPAEAAILTPEVFTTWISYIDRKPKTIETYSRALKQFYKYVETLPNPTKPTRADIIAWRQNMEQRGLKATTRQNYMAVVKIFFNWTATVGIYPNITKDVEGAKISKNHKRDYLTAAQLKNVLEEIDTDSLAGKRDYAIVALMCTSALRTVEVQRANVEDLRTLGGDTVLYIQGKGQDDNAEYVKVSRQVEKAIRIYLKARQEKEGTAPEAGAPLFVSTSNNNTGARMTTRAISGRVKSKLQAAGYDSDRLTAHSLRHSAITLARLAGQDLEEVKHFARHANIATTLIYDHAIDKSKNQCAATVSDAIF